MRARHVEGGASHVITHCPNCTFGASHVVLLASQVNDLSIKLEEAYQDKAYQCFKTVQVTLMSKGATF